MKPSTIGKQIQQNLLALISLIVAISALSYTSWRNEISEDNRNHRAAGFEIMREAAHFQLLVDQATFSDSAQFDPIQGWVRVNLILSLSRLMSEEIQNRAANLKLVWSENWSSIMEDKNSNRMVSESISQLVTSVSKHLERLK
ncbi:hypothetical protein [Aliikangiella coralliicola]|uniref:Uncharacterized protein n=1 Tax=Aliikangiella coralliicola TaxID=2592383 RepID=A0A545U8L1_9GAMM|nr:hypothetical protein [Aliikangiella coralliicola]TQV85798.1 hypothetical protein FLL46_17895 [Aliikangiella coralliicola]